MNFKPFRPPSFRKTDASQQNKAPYESNGPSKRRKLSPDDDDDHVPTKYSASSAQQPRIPSKHERLPLKPVPNPASPTKYEDESASGKACFSIVWRKVTAKKNKTWEDDGVLVYKNGLMTAYNSKGHRLGSCVRDKVPELEDSLSMSGKDVQIEAEVTYDEFCRIVGRDNSAPKDESVVILHGQPPSTQKTTTKPAHKMSMQEQMRQQIQKDKSAKQKAAAAVSKQPSLPSGRNSAFRQPLKDTQILQQVPSEVPIPRHDPTTPNALVFKRPKRAPAGKQIVDVVLDPCLTKHLREHQREGVQFLYECVMGLRDFGGQGCILADDMGLGKTLQTIALIWTLVKQNPIYKDDPIVKKVLIVCPVTLVENWKKEFRKWLGRDKLGVMSFGDNGSRLSMFDGRNFKVMVVGYERLQKIAEDLTRGAGIDLIICDEGHRLKTLQNKSAKAMETLNSARRVILSGTPIQNDLSEFFAMVNFVNDGVLGSPKAFLKDFEKPIMKSRQPNATEEDIEKGQEASNELAETTSHFILRRTADILSKYLPTKTEYVLFCKPTTEQANLYRHVLQTPMFKSAVGSNSSEGALQMITILKKLCNSPKLLLPKQGADEATTSTSLQTLNEMMPKNLSRSYHNQHAAKIRLLDELLHQIRNTTNDKVVLVSNYTATLDLMQQLLSALNMSFRRLDGSVTATKRQSMVDEFNRSSQDACFAFLLSAKAGGVGINLIGGNRLVLFDVDWNPAVEDQAMARIHREGQQKPCYIYRFLIKGSLEERIWQRQVVKRGLANSIMDSGNGSGSGSGPSTKKSSKAKAAFTQEELQNLFWLDENDGLRTHDLIGCGCQGKAHRHVESEVDNSSDTDGTVQNVDDLTSTSSPKSDANSDSEDDKPLRTFTFTPTSQITPQDLQDQEASISAGSSPRKPSPKKQRKKQEEELQELMTYTHVDTADAPNLDERGVELLGGAVGDSCLLGVLRQGRDVIPGGIGYVFLKRSGVVKVGDGEDVARVSGVKRKSINEFMAV
ncbi:helicase [Knufia obscura]|uniref:Helicase n=1 Tax=Knufia obscura TaxID=1635080 RepID=A0ABR0RCA1_9EURO|nr:helicase [Knufia obscura]